MNALRIQVPRSQSPVSTAPSSPTSSYSSLSSSSSVVKYSREELLSMAFAPATRASTSSFKSNESTHLAAIGISKFSPASAAADSKSRSRRR
ncbi:hypothetical protein SISSUDRAFT_1064526 [Sistotremastrum suecicum HHB10207 ss-3]|uniref:Uncharacterized protein n=1 Tax=Sistotremastrum suecicum HHB10207 ss-3 TaxID=1314776 RepID=A0A166AJ92_9AGAM|nr:hypothetical protein SISSUDRAFT_1064526 [Sistotremastrum suecicum HHB10207 ss-3]